MIRLEHGDGESGCLAIEFFNITPKGSQYSAPILRLGSDRYPSHRWLLACPLKHGGDELGGESVTSLRKGLEHGADFGHGTSRLGA